MSWMIMLILVWTVLVEYGTVKPVTKLSNKVIYALPPLLVNNLTSLSDKHKNPFDVERPNVLLWLLNQK